MIADIVRTYRVDAAHRLPRLPPDHKCSRMHGHGYLVEVRVRGRVGEDTGWVMDFADVDRAAEPVVRALDHRCLNDVEGLPNPTAELLAKWIWDRLAPSLPGLREVSVAETPHARAIYGGES